MKKLIRSNTTFENSITIYVVNCYVKQYSQNLAASDTVKPRPNINRTLQLTDSELSDYSDIVDSFRMTVSINGFNTSSFRQSKKSYTGYFKVEPKNKEEYLKLQSVIVIFRLGEHNSTTFENDEEIKSIIKTIENQNSTAKVVIRRSYEISINNINKTLQACNDMIDDLESLKS